MKTALSRRARRVLAWIIIACSVEFPFAAVAGDWTITPSIQGQEAFTDNALLTSTDRRSDLITILSPGISISGESARLQAKLDYSPTLQLYAFTPGQDILGHNLYANGTATLIPHLFFFDARGYAALQPSTPGLSTGLIPSGPSALGPSFRNFTNLSVGVPSAQLTQVSSFSASPYLQRRFGGFGIGELRYTLSDTNFGGTQSSLQAPFGLAIRNSGTLTNEATATFLTGENFGRYAGRLLLDAARSTGTGVLNQAHQTIATLDSAYAATRRIAALWTIGHEQIHFGGFPPTDINDIVWGLGARLTPSPNATIIVSYGHRNGITAPYASVIYSITARTTLSASYSEGLSTVSQDIANNLSISDLNQFGQTINSQTLLPLLISNPALGLQAGLFHTKQLTGTVTTNFKRDHLFASVYQSQQLLVARSSMGSGASQRVLGANVSWSHDLSRLTTTNLGFGYTHDTFAQPANPDERLLSINTSVTYLLSSSLTGWASYYFLDRASPQPRFRLSANVVLIGLRKRF